MLVKSVNSVLNVSTPQFFSGKVNSKDIDRDGFDGKDKVLPKKYVGEKGEVFEILDKKEVFDVDNISNSKIGSKFILTPTDPVYKGLRILVSPDTVIKSKNGDIKASVLPSPISFTGKVYGSIRQNPDGTEDEVMKDAYKEFFSKGMATKVLLSNLADADYFETILNDDYNFYVPSDGDGTRYRDITTLLGGVTKPASKIPATLNGQQMKLVHVVLTNFEKTGMLEDCDFVPVEPAKGSAYAFLEGLKSGKIPTTSPIVFSWGDNFADINVTNLLKYHEDSNSDFTMLTLPVNTQRVQSLGAAKVVSEDDLTVNEFVEKPNGELAKEFVIPGTKDSCLGVVGPYVLSKKALEWIKENYTKNPDDFFVEGKGFDFSAGVISQLVNDDGFKVTAYKKPKTDTWSDLGSGKDFKTEIVNVKKGDYSNFPLEIRKSMKENVDNKNNISFDQLSQGVFESFCDNNGLNISNAVVYFER